MIINECEHACAGMERFLSVFVSNNKLHHFAIMSIIIAEGVVYNLMAILSQEVVSPVSIRNSFIILSPQQ